MWMIGIAAGAVLLSAGFLTKGRSLSKVMMVLGAVLLALGVLYGGLVVLLLGGID